MGIIKKKDILKRRNNQVVGKEKKNPKEIVHDKKKIPKEIVNSEAEPLDELVDGDGSHIEGGTHNTSANSEIKTAPGQTTDDFEASGIQPNNFFYGIYGSPYSRGSRGGSYVNAGYVHAVDKIKKILGENKK